MFIAVVHGAGVDAARQLIARSFGYAGEPSLSATHTKGVLAGWRAVAPIRLDGHSVVEGWLDAPSCGQTDLRPEVEDLAKARGDFALCTLAQDGLIAASGPGGGHRPLFVIVQRDWVAVSTRLRLLLALLNDRPPLDMDYLAAAVTIDYPISLSATPFAGIQHIPLGEAWVLRPGAAEERRSLLIDPPRNEAQGTERDYACALREALGRAVLRATRGATNIGVAFSGGLDSSSVLLMVNHLRDAGHVAAQVHAYSWEFDTPDPGDDRPYRRAVERTLGAPVHTIPPEEAGPFVRRGMVLDAMPCTDVPCGLWLAIDRAAAECGVDRLLTGAGGDNVLDGNPALLSELARRGSPVEALRRAIRLRGVWQSTAWLRINHFVVRPTLRSLAPKFVNDFIRSTQDRLWLDWMGPRFGPWLRERATRWSPQPITLDSSPAERYEALARMPLMADIALTRGQQEEVTRYYRADPLFDDDVLRTVATLPPLALFAGDYRRGLLRDSMSDLLPEEVAKRPDKAYMEPALARMLSAAGGFRPFEELARVRRLADLGLVDPHRFRKHFERLERTPLDGVWWSVWPALATEEFLRQHDEGWIS